MTLRRFSLQTRLMITVLGIVSILLVLVTVVSAFVVRGSLNAGLSDQVRTTASRLAPTVQKAVTRGGVSDATALLDGLRGVPEQMVVLVRNSANEFSGAYLDENGVTQTLTVTDLAAVLSSLSVPQKGRELDLADVSVPGIGDCRLTIVPFGSPDGTTPDISAVVGLPVSIVEHDAARLLWPTVLVTLGGLLLLGVATVLVIRSGLRPLRDVVATAERVAALKLDEGEGAIPDRVAADAVDEHTEVGRVGAALNTMLDHVDASMRGRARNEELMRQFVADASHELRTPLAAIRGYSELSLRDPENPESTASSLERIQAQSVRMTRLVEDLLLLARLDEGQELVLGDVDLTPLAIEALSDAQIAGPDHEWDLDIPDAPVLVHGDVGRLHQVVGNLLANARTHTPAGSRVTLSLHATATEAEITVNDDGPGISEHVREQLFERFARADRSRDRKTGGTGLGLSIAQAIAVAHGGALTVDSEPGDTTFTLTLPLARTDASPPVAS